MIVIVTIVLAVALILVLFSRSGHKSRAFAADRRVDCAHDRERVWCLEKVTLQQRIKDLETTLGIWTEFQSDRAHLSEHQFIQKYYFRR